MDSRKDGDDSGDGDVVTTEQKQEIDKKKEEEKSLNDFLNFDTNDFSELSQIEDISQYSKDLQNEIYQVEKEIVAESKKK